MTNKEIFNKYYQPWLIGNTVSFGIYFIISLRDSNQTVTSTSPERLFLLFALIILTALIFGGGQHFYNAIYRPNKQDILFDKIKDADLSDIGLVVDLEKRHFFGKYKGYSLTITTDISYDIGEVVNTRVFILPNDTKSELYERLQKKYELNTKNGIHWFTCKTSMPFGESPKIEKLKSDIIDFVDNLRFERIDPLKLKD